MNLPLLIASIVLPICALGDGLTTVHDVADGPDIETDPLLVKIFGTDKPSAFQTLGIGFMIIGAEIAVAWGCNHLSHTAGYVLAAGGFIQAGVHAYETVHNYRLGKKN